ncbi:MAG: hypothetical protein ACW976_01685, partial [Candidatus Ranarchaeia archaeon]
MYSPLRGVTTLVQIIKLGRFPFPLVGFLLYSLGFLLGSLSSGAFSGPLFLMGFVTAFSANLSVSYSNDYFDLD